MSLREYVRATNINSGERKREGEERKCTTDAPTSITPLFCLQTNDGFLLLAEWSMSCSNFQILQSNSQLSNYGFNVKMKLLPVMSPIHTHTPLTHYSLSSAEITRLCHHREPFTVIMSSFLLFSIQILVRFPTQLSPISLSQMLLSKLVFLNFRFNHSTVSSYFIYGCKWEQLMALNKLCYSSGFIHSLSLNYWVNLIVDSKKCLLNKGRQWEWKGKR